MPSPWLAVGAETDPLVRARQLQRSWERLLAEGVLGAQLPPDATAGLRPAIVESWRRSLATGLDPTELVVPIEADQAEARQRWLEHPLGSLEHVIAAQLRVLAEESQSLVVVTDASGLLLHIDGAEWLKERAREMNFLEGARLSEAVDGTNGIGTALAADHALQVFAFEHFNQRHHQWICSAAPVHDPLSGGIVGLIDLSSLWKIAHPGNLELVTTAARTMERCLLANRRDQDARLRRRYGDLMTRSTDLLVNRDGYLLDGDEPARATPFEIPEGGGEMVLDDGSSAVAEPLGQCDAYLVRRASGRAKSAPVEVLERAEQRARKLADEQAGLLQVATLVARESSPHQLFAVVAEQVARVFDVPLVRLVRYEPDGSEVVGGFSEGDDEPFPIRSRWPLDSPGVIASVWQTGRPARVDDHANVPGQVAAAVRGAGLRSAVASPIVVEGHLWGAMVLLYPWREPLPADTEARLTDFTELVATAIANAESRIAVGRLAEEQAALRRVAMLVASNEPPDAVFSAVAREVAHVFEVELTTVCRFERDAIVVLSSVGVPAFPAGSRWPLEVPSLTRTIHETGDPARIDDFTNALGLDALARDAGVKAAVGAPIVVGGSVFGSINIAATESGPFPADTEARLAAFTELVATAISNAEARRELQGIAVEQQALRTAATLVASGASPTEVFAAITGSASEVFGVPFASLIRVGPAETATMVAGCAACSAYVGTTWTVPTDDPGITRTVLKSQRPSRIEDHSRVHGPIGEAARALGVGSVVGAPVIVDGTVWGVLVVGAAQDGPPLPADARDRLVGFTELASTAIANSDSREKVERLLDEQAALRRVATLVARRRDPDELFTAVSDEVARLFGSDGAGIGRFEPDGSGVVVVGLSEGLRSIPIGTRAEFDESLASTEVYRTGRAARKELSGEDVDASGLIADTLRGMHFYSTVAAPIVVQGGVWGVLMALSARESLPSDTEDRLEKFGELVATAIANAESRTELATAEARAHELADEQAALRRVATLVARGISPEELFVAVSDEVARLLNAEITTIGRFDRNEPYEITVVGLSSGFRGLSTGTRWPQMDWLASSVVFRTGRTARREVTATRITDSNPLADAVRAMGFFSTVSAPIVVEGELWGVVTASSSRASLPPSAEKRIESFGELVATAIANADSRAALADSEAHARALAEEQAALRRVATLVAQSPASEELFSAVAREVASVLHVPGVIVTRYEPAGTVVTFGEAFGSDLAGGERYFGVGSRTPRDPGSLAAQVFDTHHPARIDDFSTLAGTIGDAARAAGLGSGCAGPIVVNGDLWGKMCVFSGPGTVLPVGTENRLHEFIELVATAISNYEARADLAASESRALELANEQAALRRIATLVAEGAAPQDVFDAVRREVAEVFDVPFTVLWRFDPDGMATVLSADRGYLGPAGTRWPIEGDTNIAAGVRQTGRAARVDFTAPGHSPGSITDAARRAGIRSGVGVPIVVEGELWGSMNVGSEKVEPLPAELEHRLERFTELLGTAIANAKSRVEVTQLAAEQAALRRVATLVAQGAEPRHVFAAVAEEVAGIIDIPVVGVYRYEADGTFTMLGIAGDTDFTVGSRWPVEEEGIAGMILATGRPARRDEDSTMPGRLSQAGRGDLMVATVGVPIVVEGSIWGFMVAVARPGRPIPTDTEERLARFTELAATAVSNANTRTELLASRARVVSAADETRRRVERDLHDGIQQWLVALALRARNAALSEAGDSAVQELSGLADDLVAVTDELREIARGIHPAILSDAGLDAALKALARRSVIRVDLDVDFQGRYDPTLEATVYYVVAESITNAVKHAQASIVEVRGGLRDGAIEFEIKDDGVGGADPRRGTGMIGLKDRVETLGGTISFASSAGAGTTIRVSLPASPGDEEDLLLRGSDEGASAPA